MLWEAKISNCASKMAAFPKGTWTAIWSPSKSALKAVQTKGWSWIAFPSINLGWNAWIPNLCKVGALFKRTGCPFKTFSKISQTTGSFLSTIFLADFTVFTIPLSIIFLMIKGLNNSAAIPLGSPHSCNFKVGPTTITDLAE